MLAFIAECHKTTLMIRIKSVYAAVKYGLGLTLLAIQARCESIATLAMKPVKLHTFHLQCPLQAHPREPLVPSTGLNQRYPKHATVSRNAVQDPL